MVRARPITWVALTAGVFTASAAGPDDDYSIRLQPGKGTLSVVGKTAGILSVEGRKVSGADSMMESAPDTRPGRLRKDRPPDARIGCIFG